jgi:hypothetical protein
MAVIADCQLRIADFIWSDPSPSIGNRQSAIGIRQSNELTFISLLE